MDGRTVAGSVRSIHARLPEGHKAPGRVSDPEVLRPPLQDRIYLDDHPPHGLDREPLAAPLHTGTSGQRGNEGWSGGPRATGRSCAIKETAASCCKSAALETRRVTRR